MEYGQTLIDNAGKMCGSFYKLHKETGFSQATISEIRNGKRKLPLEWVPVLAEIARVNARDALAMAMAEQLPKGSRARAILGGALATGVAVMLLLCIVPGLLLPSTSYAKQNAEREDSSQNVNLLYIVECVKAAIYRLLVDLIPSSLRHSA